MFNSYNQLIFKGNKSYLTKCDITFKYWCSILTVLDELEVQIQSYFEKLEFLCHGYTWNNKLELDVLDNYNEFAGKIKSFHSLYPEEKLKDTSTDQLLAFLTSIHNFMTNCNEFFIGNLLNFLEKLQVNFFEILTDEQVYTATLKQLEETRLPELDFNFVRFFYSQIINRWIESDDHYFDSFLTRPRPRLHPH